MTRTSPITVFAGVAAITAVAVGGGAAAAASAPAKARSQRSAVVRVANTRLGQVLVDSQGRTLYLFKKDSRGRSACFGTCATAWPPLRANGKPTVAGRARASLIGTITRSDGKPQVTYDGHPLYRFVEDTRPGQVNGEGVTAFGARWFAISAAGKQVSP